MVQQGGVGKICLLGSPGPVCVVDEAVVVASWVEDGKRKVKLLGCEGKVIEVDMAVDMAASSLRRSDGVVFEVDKASVMQSLTLQNFCLNCTDGIPVVEFNSKVLEKVMEYCEKHAHCNAEELKDWDADFIKVDQAMAGFDLNIKGLQILVCQAIADMLVGKTHEEIRKIEEKISMEGMEGAAQNIYLDSEILALFG
ncbi:hypothetical protein PVAP13_7KG247100 [Panicum virgatum]|uniref:SKP1 component POZ domain-containing protein n=1 Tax=Panicum virgatum TaxID=38727 RepID=A0A8T0QK59_PANVG|nr:hypothetical protein PVAP13_7KG247100 [Panicum virgatum]